MGEVCGVGSEAEVWGWGLILGLRFVTGVSSEAEVVACQNGSRARMAQPVQPAKM